MGIYMSLLEFTVFILGFASLLLIIYVSICFITTNRLKQGQIKGHIEVVCGHPFISKNCPIELAHNYKLLLKQHSVIKPAYKYKGFWVLPNTPSDKLTTLD